MDQSTLLFDADRIKNDVKQLQKKRFSYDSCDGVQNEDKVKNADFSIIKSEVKELQKERFNLKGERQEEQYEHVTSKENNVVTDSNFITHANTFSQKECNSDIKVVEKEIDCNTFESTEVVLDRNSFQYCVQENREFCLTARLSDPTKSSEPSYNQDHLSQTSKSKEIKELDQIASDNIQKYLSILCSGYPEIGDIQSVTCEGINTSQRKSLNINESTEGQNSNNNTEIVNDKHKLTSTTSLDGLTNCHNSSEESMSLIQPSSDKTSVQQGSNIYNSASFSNHAKSLLTKEKTDCVILSDINPSITLKPNQRHFKTIQANSSVISYGHQVTKQNIVPKSPTKSVTSDSESDTIISSHSKINISKNLNTLTGLQKHIPLINLDESVETNFSDDTGSTVESRLIKSSQVTDASNRRNCSSFVGKNKDKFEITHESVPSSSFSQSFPNTSILDSKSPQKAALESQNLRLSYNLSQNPSKFSPHGKVNGFDILMGRKRTPQKKSPSKRLGKNSPVKFVLKNKSPKKFKYRTVSPNKSSPVKNLNFDETNGKLTEAQSTQIENSTYIAYYKEFVNYFECILDNVLRDNEMSMIIQNECEDITAFKNLEDLQSKKLYIRMLGRKNTWHRVSDIKYDDIGTDDVNGAFSYLEAFGFVTSDYSSEKLDVLLHMLRRPELQSLCKIFRIQPVTLPKPKLIEALLNYGRQPTVFGSTNSLSLLLNRLRENLGYCIKLCEDKRQSFLRIFLLFSLSHQDTDEDREVSKQLILLHYVKTNKVEFPLFTIDNKIPVFSTREELICFEEANGLLAELKNAMDAKNWCNAGKCGQKASEQLDKILQNSFISSRAVKLPLFLRKYTGGSTYAYVMHYSIEGCKKTKEFTPLAVKILHKLLSQDIYLPQYRGNWYEQLALLQQVHFKNYVQAAETVIEAMNDNHLDEVQQQVISGRASLLLSRRKQINNDLKLRLAGSIKEPLVEPPNATIKAKAIQTTAPGYKKVYIREDHERGEITYCSVEECVISHYRSRGYTEGVHAEGSIITTLFGLLFWDIIYEHPVPDVFRSQYQREPLDLCSGEFYKHREEIIDKRLRDLYNSDVDHLKNHILDVLHAHEGQESLVNWQRFRDVNQIMSFIECLSMEVLTKILERVVKSFRSVRKGFPDLAVWNPTKRECKFVEVKGPNDRLSIPQKLWLNYLIKCNTQCAEVCYVETTGSKELLRKKRARPTIEEDL